jgi:hypothetical protein
MDDKAGLRTAPRGLTRAQVAELLGIPESEVGRMDGRLLHPVRTDDRRWLYELAEVRTLLDRTNGSAGGKPIVSGETTAQVFELFEAGKTLTQAVIATQQTADTIMHLRAYYAQMTGTMVLSADALSGLRKAIGREFRPETLVEVVQSALHQMFEEGREDAMELGFVRDRKTGEMKPILLRPPRANGGAVAAFTRPIGDAPAAAQPNEGAGEGVSDAPSRTQDSRSPRNVPDGARDVPDSQDEPPR